MIASGQGFFVQTTATGQTFSFRETAKTITQPAAISINKLMDIQKSFAALPQPQQEQQFRLRLVNDSLNTDEVVLLFNSQDTTIYSPAKDALDLGGNGALESLSLLSADSVELSIHRRPFPKKVSEAVPLFVDAAASGTYQLKKIQLNLAPLYELWLKDALMKDSLDIVANDTYSFNVDKTNPASFGAKRFSLVIRQNPAFAYHLLNFTAAKVANVAGREVQLAWVTEHEANYTTFTVERSVDGGKTFIAIGALQGSSMGTYSLLNDDPIIGVNLYRLKQEDVNNTITYSKVVQVAYADLSSKLGIAGNISVYPNPASSTLNIAILTGAGTTPSYSYRITNSSGVLVKQATAQPSNWQTNVSDLMPGTYIITAISGKDNSVIGNTKFVKL